MKLELRDIGARLSADDESPLVVDTLIVEGQAWADSSFDLRRGLEVVELSAAPLPVDPADLQAR